MRYVNHGWLTYWSFFLDFLIVILTNLTYRVEQMHKSPKVYTYVNKQY